jgi:SAM-dependent methyltransferase
MDKPPPTEDAREEAQIAYWNDATAANWVALEERIDPVLAPLSTLALEAAAPEPGERALDIGSGCGGTVLELAGRVGPTGHVLGIDVSVPMSALARERIEAARLANADILVADATTYGFASGDRDLLFSRLGVMFFADPAAALTNLRRATRAGGRIEWIVWRALAENPWFAVPLRAALPLLPPAPVVDPLAPGPFAFTDAERVQYLLRAAGWRNSKVVRHDVRLRLAATDDFAAAAEMTTWMGPLSRRLAGGGGDAELRAAVQRSIESALHAHTEPDGIMLIASVWLVSANA